MFEKIVVPLLLADHLLLVDGKTRFQKLSFLIQKRAENSGIHDISYDFKLYLHGPFSFELSSLIDDLVRNGYLVEQTETTPFGFTKYLYALTDKGRNILKEAMDRNLISNQISDIIAEVARRHGRDPLQSLVEEAYQEYLGTR